MYEKRNDGFLHDGNKHKHQVTMKKELTWQDIKRIVTIADDILPDPRYKHDLDSSLQSEEAYYKEVLRRFKEGRK